MRLWFYVAKRLGLAVITLLGVIVAVFIMTRILPGDPAVVMAANNATPAVLQSLRQVMGLDRPLPLQLGSYMVDVLHGNLGVSPQPGHSLLHDLLQPPPPSVES